MLVKKLLKNTGENLITRINIKANDGNGKLAD